MLNGRRILLGVTGGIAAYKSVDLVSRLKKAGAEMKVILTEHATRFISPLTFASLNHDLVATDMFIQKDPLGHITLAEWAELLVIAPTTANMVGKLANGIADDLLSTAALAHTGIKLLVPAMNVHMWQNPIVQDNLSKLSHFGWHVMRPASGLLACGDVGEGKMPEPAEIAWAIQAVFAAPRDLVGKRVLVTAGGCREAIDPVRYLGNRSSGRMGLALARAAHFRGAEVTLIHAAIDEPVPPYLYSIYAESATDMRKAVLATYPDQDIVFMSAAVTDYTPVQTATEKLKKTVQLDLQLTATPDILAELGRTKTHQILVGFALESDDIIARGREKLTRKGCDYLAANHATVLGRSETTIEWLSSNTQETLHGSKFEVAEAMLDRLVARGQ